MKKFALIVLTFLACCIFTLAVLFAVLHSPKVQTALVNAITKELSRGLEAEVHIGKVNYKFFNQLELTDVLICDQFGETLLSIKTLNTHFNFWKFFRKEIHFDKIALHSVEGNIYQVSPENAKIPLKEGQTEWNFSFLIRAFATQEKKEFNMKVSLKDIALSDAHFVVKLPKDTFDVRNLNASLALNELTNSKLDAQIKHLNFEEANGFTLKKLEVHLIADKQQAQMKKMRLELAESRFDLDHLTIQYGNQSLKDMAFQFGIREGHIVPNELERFIPDFSNFHAPIDIAMTGGGRIDSIDLQNCAICYDSDTILRGKVACTGLPDWQTAYVKANLEELRIDIPMVQDILSRLPNKSIELPEMVYRLGNMRYAGELSGRMDSLHLDGRLSTHLGSVRTLGQIYATDTFDTGNFIGTIEMYRFDLGKLLNNKDLGRISLTATLDGAKGVNYPLHMKLNVQVPLLEYKNHAYHSLRAKGNYADKRWEGEISMNDSLIDFAFNGLADFGKVIPEIDAQLDIHTLHLGEVLQLPKYPDAVLSADIVLKGEGSNLDNLNGVLNIDNLHFTQSDKEFSCDFFKVTAENKKQTKLKIQSPFITADLYGDYRYSKLKDKFTDLASRLLPSTFQQHAVRRTKEGATVDLYAYCSNLDSIFKALDLPVRIPDMVTIRGYNHDDKDEASFQMNVPQFNYKTVRIREFVIDLATLGNDEVRMATSFINKSNKQRMAGQQLGDMQIRLYADMKHDSLETQLNFANIDTLHNEGQLNLVTHFGRYNKRPLIDLHILPSQFVLLDSVWTLADSRIVYNAADTTLDVQHFHLENSKQSVYANGMASTQEEDSIHINLENVDLGYILSYTPVVSAIQFGGDVTGWATVYSLFHEPKFEADLTMPQGTMNGYFVGDAAAHARWNRDTKTIDIWGDVVDNQRVVAHVDGIVNPPTKKWRLDVLVDSVNLQFINGWTDGIVRIKDGRGFGTVVVDGDMKLKKTYVTCRALAKEAALGIDQIGTTYYFTDSVFMDTTALRFEEIDLHDKYNNLLHLNGKLTHDGQWQDMKYRLDVQCHNALAMDLPEDIDNFWYGQVFANGNVTINGDMDECHINANATTAKNTDFRLNFSSNNYARSNDFVTFIDRTPKQQVVLEEEDIIVKKQSNTNVIINLKVDATPDANIMLILDNRAGDNLVGKGEGSITFKYDWNTDDIQMRGAYELEQGSYHFTFQNIIQKDFAIKSGSRIIWTGDPEDPQIDATASYSTTASLKDLFGTDYEQVGTNRSSVPVECLLYMRDRLMNPVLSFGLELPQSDEAIRSQVKSVISTDEMLVRQILYLLIFNRFYTPEYLMSDNTVVGLNETYSLLSSTVTAQLNNWISKLTKNFTVGFNIRTDGQGSDASQEYETQFQIQPSSKILINGNFGYRYNDIANQPIFGNLDVEYLISQNGHWRAKAYTHTVDKYSVRQAQTIQGIGLLFKYDFMTMTKQEAEFYKAYNKQQRKEAREAQKIERAEKKAARQAKRATHSTNQ